MMHHEVVAYRKRFSTSNPVAGSMASGSLPSSQHSILYLHTPSYSTPSKPKSHKSSQGSLRHGESKVIPPPSRYIQLQHENRQDVIILATTNVLDERRKLKIHLTKKKQIRIRPSWFRLLVPVLAPGSCSRLLRLGSLPDGLWCIGNLHPTMDGDREGDPHWSPGLSHQGPNEEQKKGEHKKESQDHEGTTCARNIIGVIPYFPYSKQSKMRKRGSIVCKLLASMLANAVYPGRNYRNAIIVAKSPDAAKRAQSYAERLHLGLAVIYGEAQCTELDMDDGRHSPAMVKNATLHSGL
ncbi:hypothetical protein U0070_007142 [Myodes glareolus]|uniref:Ribose-phosphate pyrophosphokinase N-terminal domain-containing protein n=1 Tax=Myodes glareolus TaxID=447135 RepID=A0AAW0JNH5_MYOGA